MRLAILRSIPPAGLRHDKVAMIGAILLLVLLSVLTVLVTVRHKRKINYWKNKNVVIPPSKPIFGHYGDYIVLKKYVGEVSQKLCQAYPNEPYIGTLYGSEPALLIKDPELLKLVFTKDFYYFSSREVSKHTEKEVFTRNLFFTYGDRWRVIRQNLTTVFTSSKMRRMFHLIEKCSHIFEEILDHEITLGNVIEARELTARFTVEVIGVCAFGVEMKSMKESKNNPFIKLGRTILQNSTYSGLKLIWRAMWPAIFYGLRFKAFDTSIDTFSRKFLKVVFQARNYKPTDRHDFIDCLMTLKINKIGVGDSIINSKPGVENKKAVLEFDDELLMSLCLLFFAAGFETSSSTMSYTLYELAKNPDVQKKVCQEIDEYLKVRDNKLGYDCVTALPYTNACVDETLRLYPVLALLTREVVEDYTFPSGLTLEKDMRVHIPVYHMHHNPEYFPEPEKFRPERFLPEEQHKIRPYTYIPFGEGPRLCTGMRFAKMQMNSALVTIMKKFTVELAEGTPEKLTFDPRSIVTMPMGGLPLKFTVREGWEQRVLQK